MRKGSDTWYVPAFLMLSAIICLGIDRYRDWRWHAAVEEAGSGVVSAMQSLQTADPGLHFFEPSTQPIAAFVQTRILSRKQHPREWDEFEIAGRHLDQTHHNRPSNLFLSLAEYLAASSAATGLSVLYRVLKKARRRYLWLHNRCEDCGYSLVGNISGVCPECGAMAREPPIFG